jgi:hypothetical protein
MSISSQLKAWPDIPGFFDFQDIYDQAVLEAKDGARFVEVGTFLGKSAAYMASKILEARKEIALICVDSWDERQYAQWWIDVRHDPPSPWPVEELYGMTLIEACTHCIHSVGLQRLIHPMRESSTDAARMFKHGSLDFVFIDADHRYAGISTDIAAWRGKVKSGGILAGHDYGGKSWPDVTRAVDEAFPGKVEKRHNSWLVRM